jgi:hypothetical protein
MVVREWGRDGKKIQGRKVGGGGSGREIEMR